MRNGDLLVTLVEIGAPMEKAPGNPAGNDAPDIQIRDGLRGADHYVRT